MRSSDPGLKGDVEEGEEGRTDTHSI
jgi:hypothetical protein